MDRDRGLSEVRSRERPLGNVSFSEPHTQNLRTRHTPYRHAAALPNALQLLWQVSPVAPRRL